jgi:hypothetical protein
MLCRPSDVPEDVASVSLYSRIFMYSKTIFRIYEYNRLIPFLTLI